MTPAEPARRLPPLSTEGVGVRFDGRGRDYFRIWIGDVLAMMLTLGLYWPWMRRRRWQFLDACTWLGPHPLGNPDHARQPGAWPRWQQQVLVGLLLVGLWFLTRRYGVFGWPRLFVLFSLTGPWWLQCAWRGRVAHWQIEGAVPRFTGHLLLACGVWLLMCLLLVPAALFQAALFLDNIRIWLLGASWSARIGISEGMRQLLPWLAGGSVALALAGWHFCSARFGLDHLDHPAGRGRCRMRFWPVLRAALIATVLVLPAPFLAVGLIYANWPVLLSTLSIEPPATLENLTNLAPDGTLLGSLRLDGSQPDGSPLVGAGVCVLCRASVVLLLVLVCGLVMMMGWRYFKARFWNYRLTTFTLAGHAFESHLPAGRLMATGFVCDVLTVLTLGLYHPFGVVRMARLCRESVRVLPLPRRAVSADGASPAMPGRAGAAMSPPTAMAAGAAGRLLAAGTVHAVPAPGTGAVETACVVATTGESATLPLRPALPRAHLPWPLALLGVVVPVLLGAVFSLHAKPTVGMMLVRHLPPALTAEVGEEALRALQRAGVGPSALSEESRQHVQAHLRAAVQRAWPAASLPPWRLQVVKGGDALGANALALPGGIILITDELLALVASRPDREAVLLGVFGHELAHLIGLHPEQALVMNGLRASLRVVITGRGRDELVASGAETVLNLGYNTAMAQAADRGARQLMQANGHDPALMADFLLMLAERRASNPVRATAARRIAASLASQPVDAPRLRLYRAAPRIAH